MENKRESRLETKKTGQKVNCGDSNVLTAMDNLLLVCPTLGQKDMSSNCLVFKIFFYSPYPGQKDMITNLLILLLTLHVPPERARSFN